MVGDLIHILVEGPDDKRFFQTLQRHVSAQFQTWEYASQTRTRRENFLRSLGRMQVHYLYLTDLDPERFPCAPAKKQHVCQDTRGLERRKVIVVVSEIEGWYLAGLSAQSAQELGVKVPDATDTITKEDFNRLRPTRFDSRIDFMVELLKHFEPSIAGRRNGSFAYFLERMQQLTS